MLKKLALLILLTYFCNIVIVKIIKELNYNKKIIQMENKNKKKERRKYPEQTIYRDILDIGKVGKIAKAANVSVDYVRGMINGYNLLTEDVKTCIDVVIKNQNLEKLQLEVALEKILGPSKEIKNTKLI